MSEVANSATKDPYTIRIEVACEANMFFPTEELLWQLRYGEKRNISAASCLDSYEYLIYCSQKEALRRLRIIKKELKQKLNKG